MAFSRHLDCIVLMSMKIDRESSLFKLNKRQSEIIYESDEDEGAQDHFGEIQSVICVLLDKLASDEDIVKAAQWVDLKPNPKDLTTEELKRVVDHNIDYIDMMFRNNQGSAYAEERMYGYLAPYTDEIDSRKT